MSEIYETTEVLKSEADIHPLLDQIAETRYIAQVTQAEIEAWMAQGTIRFFYREADLAGFGAWIAINEEWSEAGPFYVASAHRGAGLGRELLRVVTAINLSQHRKIVGVTINPAMRRLFADAGYWQVSQPELPPAVNLYLLKKLTPARVLNMLKNLNTADKVAYYIKY